MQGRPHFCFYGKRSGSPLGAIATLAPRVWSGSFRFSSGSNALFSGSFGAFSGSSVEPDPLICLTSQVRWPFTGTSLFRCLEFFDGAFPRRCSSACRRSREAIPVGPPSWLANPGRSFIILSERRVFTAGLHVRRVSPDLKMCSFTELAKKRQKRDAPSGRRSYFRGSQPARARHARQVSREPMGRY